MNNVRILDNGAAFCVTVNGLIVSHHSSLGGAWEHIRWMYAVASQRFTVGKSETPVTEWLRNMVDSGFMDDKWYPEV